MLYIYFFMVFVVNFTHEGDIPNNSYKLLQWALYNNLAIQNTIEFWNTTVITTYRHVNNNHQRYLGRHFRLINPKNCPWPHDWERKLFHVMSFLILCRKIINFSMLKSVLWFNVIDLLSYINHYLTLILIWPNILHNI